MDPNIILFGALGVMIVFMFMNNKKRKKQAEDLQTSIVVGSYVMLTSGIYGTVAAFEGDKVILETAPGTKLVVNKLAIRQVEANKPATAKAPAAAKPAAKKASANKAAAKKPAAKTTSTAVKKPAAKKSAK
ncbi:preprotein translocase subunit YajC [Rhodoluna sp.]|uniref:preprotein translocase subunit YajC n=1 Tax=Rhodoluna sp. TaxID=1969481 RepID=UPI0025E6548D|nr:preprotein translocase subunit YajC [Rhodoluna sp.]